MFFNKKDKNSSKQYEVSENENSVMDSEMVKLFLTGCFTSKPFLSNLHQEVFTYMNNILKSDFLAFPKVRLIEFLNPVGNIDEQKRLVIEIQNLTADIIIIDESNSNLFTVILIEPENKTAFYEKKLSHTKRICQVVGVDFTVLKEVIDIENNNVIDKYLKED